MRTKGVLTNNIPKYFINGMTGYNSHDVFCSVLELNERSCMERRAKSFDMIIAFFRDGVVYMPEVDSSFNLTASKTTNRHMDLIYRECRKEKVQVKTFIPALGFTYYSGRTAATRLLHNHIVQPMSTGYHLSKRTWKTERGAIAAACEWIEHYQRYINFANMDIECVDGDWHIRLDYKPLFIPAIDEVL